MIIKQLKIKNFRNIKNIDIDFSSNSSGSNLDVKYGVFKDIKNGKIVPMVNAIIGPNAIGKSNILDALDMLFGIKRRVNRAVARKLFLKNADNKLDLSERKIRKETNKILIELERKEFGGNFEDFLEIKATVVKEWYTKSARRIGEDISIEAIFCDGESTNSFSVLMSENSIDFSYPKNNEIIGDIKIKRFDESLNSFFDFIAGGETILTLSFMKLGPDKMLKLIQIADPSVEDIIVNGKTYLFKIRGSDSPITMKHLSSGTKRFLWISSFLIRESMEDNCVILLDEIEPFMHKELAESIIYLMNLIARKNKRTSFIFTTHNIMLIDTHINYKQVTEVKMKDEEHVAKKLSTNFKPHQNIDSSYKKGVINPFPSKAIVEDHMWAVVNE